MKYSRLIAMLVVVACASCAAAADYPSHPIRMIVPFTPGSASDMLARMIGPKLYETWGQQVVIDNRPSAGGTVAGGIVASAAPDGHTLMLTSSGFAGAAALYDKLPYDPLKDFTGVTLVAVTPLIIVVSPNLGVKSVKELIAAAQQKPGQLNFGSSGIGSGTHFGGELFKLAAKINVTHVPYRGTPEALTDTMSGRIQFFVSPVLPAMALVRGGRLLALGVTSSQRLPMIPDVPTIAEAAIPGFEYDGWYGVFAPARTPRAIVNKVSVEVGRILKLPEVQDRITREGAAPKPMTPEQFDRMVRDEIVMRGKVFKAAGAKAN
ncbi:MAG TPA: tripartite tricarboxylate transporter substrate binding protein [Burkholderiales bacterium]|nr:tripartite tricarboxylate transporter substrate binding protein [Burkholderiales bacterium]